MNSYACVKLEDNVCSVWVDSFSILNISIDQGLKIGGLMFLACLTAWGLREIARFIIVRR